MTSAPDLYGCELVTHRLDRDGYAFEDDSRIVSLYVGKTYADRGDEGASIKVGSWSVDRPMVIHAEAA